MAQAAQIKLAVVEPLLDRGHAAAMVAAHYDVPVAVARVKVEQAERDAVRAGF
jgi:hypothetical protein